MTKVTVWFFLGQQSISIDELGSEIQLRVSDYAKCGGENGWRLVERPTTTP